MKEGPPSPEPRDSKNPDLNLDKLKFEELKSAYEKIKELARTSFCETEDGFRNVERSAITIKEQSDGVFKIFQV